ncbi:Ppx/GppA phosphatase family protein [Prochlorococcus sp. MIT 0801]|uniref:Ppx/GppA phosphatase family protein n=1 Tax=Prochlorococcus sp. MIT 0801 TaxID=1501269 RepID=UPI0004F5B59E|nr:Ppx/GppA phosphatase family protein [Prochlorococcus sp. MIT 0801]AIQ96644.1 Exopolyphosphatasee [Prochlorococcus sp. MIT 0801]
MLGDSINNSSERNFIELDLGENQDAELCRVATIDIGTNSTHLLIAKLERKLNTFSIELAEKSTTRLGERDPQTGELTSLAMNRAFSTLTRFKDLSESYKVESLIIAATSAVREAPNGKKFISEIKKKIGLDVELISGAEEARLIYLGVLSGMQFENKPHLVLDIGGGSTELILADSAEARALTSTKIGAVRLQREFIKKDPISSQTELFLRSFIRGSMESAIDKVSKRIEVGETPVLVATSGTAMAIGALLANKENHIQSKLQGYKIQKNNLDVIISQLIKMTPSERSQLSSLSERRSEIIVPGALILQTIMTMVNVNEIILSERALREGLVVDWMCRNNYLKDQLSFQGSIRERTVIHQSKRFGVNSKRSKKVSEFALTFYDQTRGTLHNDNGEGRDLLWAAAKLYACGKHINISAYHKHSWYLIRHGELLGYSQSEHLMVAAIARYHRKSLPKKRHESWQLLVDESQRSLVSDMSLLLRLACSLDRRPEPLISKIVVEAHNRKVNIELIPNDLGQNLDLEKWSLTKAILLIKKIKHVDINIL